MPAIPCLSENALEKVCFILGETYGGLTGREIGTLLLRCGISDRQPGMTKRYRLHEALSARQRQDRCANNVLKFIQTTMDPVRFVGDAATFDSLRRSLNEVLTLVGYAVLENGNLAVTSRASTLTEAEGRADRLKALLRDRSVHPDVLVACRAELLQDNYFHAVLEATKSLAAKLRAKTGITTDGCALVDTVFGLKNPLLAFNSLQTQTEQSEQTGLMEMMKGMFLAFRNPLAHELKVSGRWRISEADAIDILTLVSLLHRRVDAAVSTRPPVAASSP